MGKHCNLSSCKRGMGKDRCLRGIAHFKLWVRGVREDALLPYILRSITSN